MTPFEYGQSSLYEGTTTFSALKNQFAQECNRSYVSHCIFYFISCFSIFLFYIK